jgi:phage repressor protein C with HTH and peptisase S24 domain
MARRKTLPESVRAKLALAERLSTLRLELFGERGGPEMARRIGIPVRTWYNYEGGVTVPAEVVLKIIELTAVEPVWLLHGKGPKFRQQQRLDRHDVSSKPAMTVGALLRTALQLLENERTATTSGEEALDRSDPSPFELPMAPPASKEWLEAQHENRCLLVTGNAMAPVLADGAYVAYSKENEDPRHLDGKMVVVWLEQTPTIRWFRDCGRYALLRAENPETSPQQQLIDLESPEEQPRIRRVLWIDTPH